MVVCLDNHYIEAPHLWVNKSEQPKNKTENKNLTPLTGLTTETHKT
jgi:hypothetical protein